MQYHKVRERPKDLIEIMRVRSNVTVDELARELHLTRTAVVNRLKSLISDGLVRRSGLRRGLRRPSIEYALTADADRVFPKLYEQFSHDLIDELTHQRAPQLRRVIRGVTHRWIQRNVQNLQRLRGRKRLDQAVGVLSKDGFLPELDRSGRTMTLRHFNCPLRSVCADSPEVREMIRRWIEALFGLRTQRTACLCKGAPSCTYELGRGAGAA